jgi:hypothetical protein
MKKDIYYIFLHCIVYGKICVFMNVIEMTMSVLTNQKKADMSDMTESK